MMKDVTKLLEERLAGAPIAGTLTSDELAAVAEGEADFAAGFFTVDPHISVTSANGATVNTKQRTVLDALWDAPADASALGGLPAPPPSQERMYAITFDLDTEALQQSYPGPSWQNAYGEIRKLLTDEGFTWQQGSVYFGGERINAVTCVLAAQRLARELPWFAASVWDIRMLRIEDLNDLGPAIGNNA